MTTTALHQLLDLSASRFEVSSLSILWLLLFLYLKTVFAAPV
jgi:hypothetical protein